VHAPSHSRQLKMSSVAHLNTFQTSLLKLCMHFSSLHACLMSHPFCLLDFNIQIILVLSTYYEAPCYVVFTALSYFLSTLFSSILNICSPPRMRNPSFTPCCFSISCENTSKLLTTLMITLCYIRTQCTVNSWLSSIQAPKYPEFPSNQEKISNKTHHSYKVTSKIKFQFTCFHPSCGSFPATTSSTAHHPPSHRCHYSRG
jgi:hypothetical protein